jgi:hypothetical protein
MTRGPVCPQHKCHPNDCFEIHYPESARGRAPTEEEIRLAIIREHTQRQHENIRRKQEEMSRSVVDARKRFEEGKDRNRRKGA